MNNQLERARQAAVLMRERIRAELGEDEEAMLSAVESETDFNETVILLAREAKRREGYAAALKGIIGENRARQERHERAAETIREAIAKAMLEIGSKKIESPDLTINVRVGAQGVRVIDESALPEWAWKETIVRKPDLAKIKAVTDMPVPGTVITNGTPILTLRGV